MLASFSSVIICASIIVVCTVLDFACRSKYKWRGYLLTVLIVPIVTMFPLDVSFLDGCDCVRNIEYIRLNDLDISKIVQSWIAITLLFATIIIPFHYASGTDINYSVLSVYSVLLWVIDKDIKTLVYVYVFFLLCGVFYMLLKIIETLVKTCKRKNKLEIQQENIYDQIKEDNTYENSQYFIPASLPK